MAQVALECAHGHLGAKDAVNRLRLCGVAHVSSSGVRVDVLDIGRRQFCVPQGCIYRDTDSVRIGISRVCAVAARTISDDLRVDGGATTASVLILLEHQAARAFADHQAIAAAVKRARGLLGALVEARRGSEHDVEDPRVQDVQFFRPARDTDRYATKAHLFVADPDPLGSRSARCARGDERPFAAKHEGDVGGTSVAHELQVGG